MTARVPARMLRTTLAALALVLVVAACGSSGSGGSSASASVAPLGSTRPLVIYHAILSGSGRPAGAPFGRGFGIVALHPGSVVCWRFAHLHGFTIATYAKIYSGASPGPTALSLGLGPRLHHKGCVSVPKTLTKSIQASPSSYTVVVDSNKYPAGAVRGRL